MTHRNKDLLTGARLLAYIENSAGLVQYSLRSVYSMRFDEKGLSQKKKLVGQIQTNLELLSAWVSGRELGPVTLEYCRRLYRQNADMLARTDQQRRDIQDYLTAQQLRMEFTSDE